MNFGKSEKSLLSVKYRVKTENGKMMGGAMVVLDKVLNMRWLSVIFCIFTAIAAFGIGNMTQANSISVLLKENFDVSNHEFFLTDGMSKKDLILNSNIYLLKKLKLDWFVTF